MDFKTATDRLTARVTLADIAEACGSAINSISARASTPTHATVASRRQTGSPCWRDWRANEGIEFLKLAGELDHNIS